jgi:ubiquinone/menaquinone biosynthesis C-methylase UbiE
MSALHAPAHGRLTTTGPLDWIARYDARLLGAFLRRRFVWVAAALPPRLGRVLEIGYGSGFFQYELARRSELSVALDIHPHGATVAARLHEDGVPARLLRADADVLPLRDGAVDAVVIVSALEFVPDPAACLRECRRVLRPGGWLVCVRPRALPWADVLCRWVLGIDPEATFRGGRDRVDLALRACAPTARRHPRPAGLPRAIAPYELVVMREPGTAPP